MDLKSFIKETISQMAEAVYELNNNDNSPKIIVNPTSVNGKDMITTGTNSYKQTTIQYHVAITLLDEGSTEGKIGILTGVFGGGVGSGSKNQSQALTSLDFSLDVILPQG